MFIKATDIGLSSVGNLMVSPVDLNISYNSDVQVNVVLYFTDKNYREINKLYNTLFRSFHFPNFAYHEIKKDKDLSILKTKFYIVYDSIDYRKCYGIEGQDCKKCKIDNCFKKFVDKTFKNRIIPEYFDVCQEIIEGDKNAFIETIKVLIENSRNYVLASSHEDKKCSNISEKEILHYFWKDIESIPSVNSVQLDEIKCRLEHNHWCAVKHTEGFRSLSEKELAQFKEFELAEEDLKDLHIQDSINWHVHKEMYKRKRMFATMNEPAHLDLCSFEDLKKRDFSTLAKDLTHFESIFKKDDCKNNSRSLFKISNYSLWSIGYGIISFILGCLLLINFDCTSITYCYNCSVYPNYINIVSRVALALGTFGTFYILWVLFISIVQTSRFDRFFAELSIKKGLLVALFIICVPFFIAIWAYLLSGINASDMYSSNGYPSSRNIFWTFLYQFTDPGNQHMVGNQKGLVWASLAAYLGMFLLNGLLVTTILSFIDRRVEGWKEGKARYNFRKSKHVIIVGGHDVVPGIIHQIDNEEIERYIIMTEQDVSTYRRQLYSSLRDDLEDKIILYRGDRTSPIDVKSLRVNNDTVKAIYVIGEGTSHSDLEPNHDTKNMTCVDLIVSERKDNPDNIIHCYTMFEHRSSYVAFQQADLPDYYKNRLYFEPFNLFEMCAQQVLVAPEYPIRPIDVTRFSEDKQGKKNYIDVDSKRRVHLVIFGMSKMGMTLASEAAIICHYPNYAKLEMLEDNKQPMDGERGNFRTLITFIDLDAEQQMHFYQNRMPSLFEISKWGYMNAKDSIEFAYTDKLNNSPANYKYGHLADDCKSDKNFLDVEWEFIQGALGDKGVDNYLESLVDRENEILTIAVCLPNDAEGLSLASTLPVDIYDKVEQVLVYQRQTDGIVRQMSGIYKESLATFRENKYSKLRPFGMYQTSFRQSLLDNVMAKKMFSKNYNILKGLIARKQNCSDAKLNELATLPILERWSAVYSSHNWMVKFRSMGAVGDTLPTKEVMMREFCIQDKSKVQNQRAAIWGRVEHNRWIMERLVKAGERPITTEENSMISENIGFKSSFKLSGSRAHLDICSMKRLTECDPETVDYDKERNYRLVEIYDAI